MIDTGPTMRFNSTRIGFALMALGGVAAMGYALLENQGKPTARSASAPAPVTARGAAQGRPAETTGTSPPAYTQYRIGNAAARTVHTDGSVIWVGTTAGLVRYDTASGQHRFYDRRDGLPSEAVLHAAKVGDKLVLGTHAGLSVFAPADGGWKHYSVADGLPDARVFGVLAASNGDLWIATWAGASRVRADLLGTRSEWRHYTVANTNGGLPADRIYSIAEDRSGGIWFATEAGVARHHGGAWTNWKSKGGPAAADAMSVAVTADGVVWAGTLGAGMGAFDGTRWRAYTTADGLPSDRVLVLHADAAGGLWIGTDKGLARFVDGKFSVLGPAEGLVSDNVYSIAAAADGTLWVGGNGGVAHLRKLAFRTER